MSTLAKLEEYYESVGISSMNFHCPDYGDCKRHDTNMVQAKAALVGQNYQNTNHPRLLFISLDPAFANSSIESRTLEGVRKEYENSDPLGGGKNRHWYRTHEIAFNILKQFMNSLTIESTKGHFAHVNSAKCSSNNPDRRQGSKQKFNNCRKYLQKEISILKPDIVITQGDRAHDSLNGTYAMLNHVGLRNSATLDLSDYQEVSVISIDETPVLWIKTYHPGCWGMFNKITRPKLDDYGRITYDFMSGVAHR